MLPPISYPAISKAKNKQRSNRDESSSTPCSLCPPTRMRSSGLSVVLLCVAAGRTIAAMSKPTATPPANSASGGFNFLSELIAIDTDKANPDISALDAAIKKREASAKVQANKSSGDKSSKSKEKDPVEAVTRTSLSKSGRDLSSQFATPNVGKLPKSDDAKCSSVSTSSRRRTARSATQPTSPSPNPSTFADGSPVSKFNSTYSLDHDLVPHPDPLPFSSIAPMMMSLTPHHVARVNEGEYVALVLPPIFDKTPAHAEKAIREVHDKIDAILRESCAGLPLEERDEQLLQLQKQHEIPRHGKIAHQYICKIKKCPEYDRMRDGTKDEVYHLYDKGAGVYFQLCGQSKHATFLLKYKQHLPYVEMHGPTSPGDAVDEGIKLSHRRADISGDFLNALWRANGSLASTTMVLSRFHNATSRYRKGVIDTTNNTAALQQAKNEEESTAAANKIFIDSIQSELSEAELFDFARWVDGMYLQRYKRKYNTTTKVNEFLMPPEEISNMYQKFKEQFPHCHAVFMVIMSSSRDSVELATQFGEDATAKTDPCVSGMDDSAPMDDEDMMQDEAEEEADTNLHRKERAALEYFLSFIRIRS